MTNTPLTTLVAWLRNLDKSVSQDITLYCSKCFADMNFTVPDTSVPVIEGIADYLQRVNKHVGPETAMHIGAASGVLDIYFESRSKAEDWVNFRTVAKARMEAFQDPLTTETYESIDQRSATTIAYAKEWAELRKGPLSPRALGAWHGPFPKRKFSQPNFGGDN